MQSSLINKTLVFLFILLFVVLIGEVGYLIYSSKNSNPGSPLSLINNSSNKSVSPAPTSNKGDATVSGVYQAVFDNFLKMGSKGAYKTASLNDSYTAKILEIKTKGYINTSTFPTGYVPILVLKLQTVSSKNPVIFSIAFNEQEYNGAYVHGASVNKLGNLKVGQIIDVQESFTVLDNNLITKYDILVK